jgi:16S rRNA (cytosine1402-N4)-methyltransferase
METADLHIPVMAREVVASLRAEEGGWFVDCTLGMGGHSKAILLAGAGASVLGVDRDPQAVEIATRALAPFGTRFRCASANFKDVDAWAVQLPGPPKGILVDLGLSGYQLKAGRGFSFRDGGSLDMRMDPAAGRSAEELLAAVTEAELAGILKRFGEERMARRIARSIVEARAESPIRDARRLGDIVARAVPRPKAGQIHPATRTFQALRIAVNEELEGLGAFLERAVGLLSEGGRIAVLAYHSLEDRIVKQTFAALAKGCVCPPRLPLCACGRRPVLRLPYRHALRPGAEEVAANPASRSARLRVGEKT